MNEQQIHDFLWACREADRWMQRGDAVEVHTQMSGSGLHNRVSVITHLEEEVVLYPEGKR